MGDLAETAERQDEIIRIQSGVIKDLFLLLLEHISAEEADRLPVLERINTAAWLREGIHGKVPGGTEDLPWKGSR